MPLSLEVSKFQPKKAIPITDEANARMRMRFLENIGVSFCVKVSISVYTVSVEFTTHEDVAE
jgi:hypothetical protein